MVPPGPRVISRGKPPLVALAITVYLTIEPLLRWTAGPGKNEAPKLAEGQGETPTFSAEQATRPEQALLYRLTGDLNPLHADPAFALAAGFEQGPILHGLCTYGFVGRAVLEHACGGDPARLKALSVQFRKPVWPGDVLSTRGFDVGGGRYVLQTSVVGRPEAVLTSAWAEVA